MFLGMPDTDLDFASTNQVSLCVCEFEIVLLKKKKKEEEFNTSKCFPAEFDVLLSVLTKQGAK